MRCLVGIFSEFVRDYFSFTLAYQGWISRYDDRLVYLCIAGGLFSKFIVTSTLEPSFQIVFIKAIILRPIWSSLFIGPLRVDSI